MNIAIILAAGNGSRLDLNTPKQIIKVENKPLFSYCFDVFNASKNIDKILMVCSAETINEIKDYIGDNDKVVYEIGSTSRFYSLKKAIEFLKPNLKDTDILLIHDADRPYINEEIINENIEECKKVPAVVTALKSVDSIINCSKDLRYENRDFIYQVQTPQTFKYEIIKKFIDDDVDYKDEGSAARAHNISISIVKGSPINKKITTNDDLLLFEAYLKNK